MFISHSTERIPDTRPVLEVDFVELEWSGFIACLELHFGCDRLDLCAVRALVDGNVRRLYDCELTCSFVGH